MGGGQARAAVAPAPDPVDSAVAVPEGDVKQGRGWARWNPLNLLEVDHDGSEALHAWLRVVGEEVDVARISGGIDGRIDGRTVGSEAWLSVWLVSGAVALLIPSPLSRALPRSLKQLLFVSLLL